MIQLIKPKTFNFNELVKNSYTTLSLNCQSKLIKILNKEFSHEEQQWYIANLYVYMNYHPTNDYPINLEHIFKMIGFANKGNAMKTIKSNFVKDEDYKIVIFRTEKNLDVKDLGGRRSEDVMLNIDTFKNLCMIAKTEKGKEIRKYYVKLENIYNQIIKEEIEEKQKELEEKDKQLEYTKNELQKMSICKIKKWYNVEPGDTVYAFKNDGQPYIKIGKAENLKKREESYTVGNRTSDIFYYRKCYNCKLTEKVINHILDKYRLQQNREWFDISDELAIYTIDIVCDFLDSYIHCSEELINLKIKERLSICLDRANEIKKRNDEITSKVTEDNIDRIPNLLDHNEKDKNNKQKKNIWITKDQDNSIKTHLDKFVEDFCEIGDDKKCLSLDILGAYRIWNKKTDPYTKQNLMTYMKKNYLLKQEYSYEHRTKFNYYMGIQPKEFIIKRENNNTLPYYEEFILSECKFAYTHRTTKTILFNEFKKWVSNKYPEYIFSKNEQTNMESYLNRTFLNCKKIHINGGTNGYYGLQLKSDPTEKLGIALSRRKKVYKVDIISGNIIETYNTLYEASNKLNIDEPKMSYLILNNISVNNEFVYKYNE
jgi:phage anti-repressor protein